MKKLIQTRAEFQTMATQRLEEAQALLTLQKWNGAYYLGGYTVELALKACIIRMLMTTDEFPGRAFEKNCYTHSIETLVKTARLTQSLDAARAANSQLDANWAIAKDWTEQSRYQQIDQLDAEVLIDAISDSTNGVLQWIKNHW